jgi:toxin-antitoxin system PIN domain toxin
MTSLSFPDINVWLALASHEHVHGRLAAAWWEEAGSTIAFTRFTQLGFLRLLTTAAAMDGKPLSMSDAWRVYNGFYRDDRVHFAPEPVEVEERFRRRTRGASVSPKIWADAWMLASAEASGATLVTFDRALAKQGAHCLLPGK